MCFFWRSGRALVLNCCSPDDHRHNFFGAYGDRLAHTPNLDGLIRRGFSFSNAYCQGANMRALRCALMPLRSPIACVVVLCGLLVVVSS